MVRVSRVDSIEEALKIANKISAKCDETVDFTDLDFISPSAALILASSFRESAIKPRINENARGFGYMSHIGFFDASGIEGVGKRMGEAKGSGSYAPISLVKTDDIKRKSKELGVTTPQLLHTRGENLARILTQGTDLPLIRRVSYAIREILRNCVDHSKSDQFWYSAQFFEQRHIVEMAVLDRGVGLRETVSSNPENNDPMDEEAAIRLALLPGVSRVPVEKRTGPDPNSGFGLYISRRVCARATGSFAIISNDKGIVVREQGDEIINGGVRGTLIQMRLDTTTLEDADDFAERLAAEGEIEARLRTGMNIEASRSSRSAEI